MDGVDGAYTSTPVSGKTMGAQVSLYINSSLIIEDAILNYVIQVSNINISGENSFCKQCMACHYAHIISLVCLDTTDVQEATIMLNHEDGSFEVRCVFAVGSRAMGCFLMLSGTFGSYSKHIPREMEYHRHSLMQPLKSLNYSVYDWEEDGSVGNVSVVVQCISGESVHCCIICEYH